MKHDTPQGHTCAGLVWAVWTSYCQGDDVGLESLHTTAKGAEAAAEELANTSGGGIVNAMRFEDGTCELRSKYAGDIWTEQLAVFDP